MQDSEFQVALDSNNIIWRKHALERMMERRITRRDVINALRDGEVVKVYSDNKPFESMLVSSTDDKPLHVVAGFDEVNMVVYIITAYIPDSNYFKQDNKTRRQNGKR